MNIHTPTYEQEGGMDKSMIVGHLFSIVHRLCNRYSGDKAELNVQLAYMRSLSMRVEHEDKPNNLLRKVYIEHDFSQHQDKMFTLYLAIDKITNGIHHSSITCYTGTALSGPLHEQPVTHIAELNQVFEWIEEANEILKQG